MPSSGSLLKQRNTRPTHQSGTDHSACHHQIIKFKSFIVVYIFWNMYTSVCLDVCDWHVGFVFLSFNRLPQVGRQMPKHVVGTVNLILLFVFYYVLLSAFLANILNIQKRTVCVTKFTCSFRKITLCKYKSVPSYLLTYLLTSLLTYLLTYLLMYSMEQSPSREANLFCS